MKIAIIGAGFTGLSAGLELAKHHCEVTIFDKNNSVGGLAGGFQQKNWDWTVEKFYHHIFTNDSTAINLAKSLGIEPAFSHPVTSVYFPSVIARDVPSGTSRDNLHLNNIYPFNGAIDLLRFPGLNLIDKIRMGTTLAAFKIIPNGRFLESLTARKSLTALMGRRGFSTIWEPLLISKFHKYAPEVNLAWFWARVKKRTPRLGTFPGGFQNFADRLAAEFIRSGGHISLNTLISPKSFTRLNFASQNFGGHFDVILSTTAQPNSQVNYLSSHILLLEMNRPFLKNVYWLNILDRSFPFLVTAEHTNFIDKKHFANTHLLYIGNYLPPSHPLLPLSPSQILQKYFPYLKKISPDFSEKQIIKKHLFTAPFAQPIVTVNYGKTIPHIKQSAKFYLANQSMIYPWDRGINYAIELGQKAAQEILK